MDSISSITLAAFNLIMLFLGGVVICLGKKVVWQP
jgi:hypothetical protein